MFRVIALTAIVIALTCGISAAQDGSNAARDFTLTPTKTYTPISFAIGKSAVKKLMPRSRITKVGYCDEDNDDGAICARRGCACGPGYNFGCCTSCYIPPGNTHGECQ
jgi:hypothetical protein